MVDPEGRTKVRKKQLLDRIRRAKKENAADELSDLIVSQQILGPDTRLYVEKDRNWSRARFRRSEFEDLDFLYFNLVGTVYEDCDFSDVKFSYADLCTAVFTNCRFSNVKFPYADLRKAVFTNCRFSNVEFHAAALVEAGFESCRFTDTGFLRADLSDAEFRACQSLGVHLDRSDLSNARLIDCDLSDVDFRNARLHRTRLSSLSSLDSEDRSWWKSRRRSIRQERDGDWEQAAEVYLLLKENFATLANHADASWAHFKERQMRRMSGGGLREWVNEFTWGYGEKPERPFRVGVLVIMLSTLLAWLLNTWWGGLAEASSLGDYLLFSAASFVLTSFPGLEAEHIGLQLLSLIVGGLGVVTLSMFTFAVGQRISSD